MGYPHMATWPSIGTRIDTGIAGAMVLPNRLGIPAGAAVQEWDHGKDVNLYLGVYGSFHKTRYPQMDGLQGKISLKWMI